MHKHHNYPEALVHVAGGGRARRHGDSQAVYLEKGSFDYSSLPAGTDPSEVTFFGLPAEHFEPGDTGTVTRLPVLRKSEFVSQVHSKDEVYTATHEDQLATDWILL